MLDSSSNGKVIFALLTEVIILYMRLIARDFKELSFEFILR